MRYILRQNGGFYSERLSLSTSGETEKTDNELLNLINASNSLCFISHDEFINSYLTKNGNILVRDINISEDDNDLIIDVGYFYHDQNDSGIYYYQEWNDDFVINKEDFYISKLGNKVLNRIEKLNEENVELSINKIKDFINVSNERIKSATEDIISEYLSSNSKPDKIDKVSYEEFIKYIEDNSGYIKNFIQDNWKYKSLFNGALYTEFAMLPIGGVGSLFMLGNGDKNSAIVMALATAIASFSAILASESIQDKLTNKELNNIKSIDFGDKVKIKSKRLEN